MKTKILLTSVFVFAGSFLGCVTEERVVNSKVTAPVLLPTTSGVVAVQPQDLPRGAALSGRVLLKGEMPRSLGGVRVGLFRQETKAWKTVHEFSSSQDGTFEITRPVEKGNYELRVTDPRYQGTMPVNLDERALQGLLFEVSPAKKK